MSFLCMEITTLSATILVYLVDPEKSLTLICAFTGCSFLNILIYGISAQNIFLFRKHSSMNLINWFRKKDNKKLI